MAAAAAVPALGAKPLDLRLPEAVLGASCQEVLGEGLRCLYEQSELCDIALLVGDERMVAHGVVLAAESEAFRKFLIRARSGAKAEGDLEDPMKGLLLVEPKPPVSAAAEVKASEPSAEQTVQQPDGGAEAKPPAGQELSAPEAVQSTCDAQAQAPAQQSQPANLIEKLEFRVQGVTHPESVRLLLNYVYLACTGAAWEYSPQSADVNRDILRLARHFMLPELHEHAARWLIRGLNTSNVVERLVTCEQCGLGLLREKIVERLAKNPAELMMVSSSPEIMQHPRILQDLLLQVACLGKKASSKPVEEEQKAEEKAEEKPQEIRKEKASQQPLEKPPAKRAKKVGGA